MQDTPAPLDFSRIIAATEGLQELEALIQTKLVSEAPALAKISAHLVGLGGKRIRPLLCLLSAKTLGMKKPSEQILKVAAGIELIHSATLLHDDIIDRSPIRRKEVSAYRKFGLPPTLLAGDFLLVRAFSLCGELDISIVKATEEACVELTEGEILETPLYSESHSKESALRIARKKTASLFRLAAECGARLGGASEESVSLMRTFGESLGTAFQVLDDILDVSGTEDVLGKAAGIDVKERKPSVVNILWLNRGTPLASRLLSEPDSDEDAYVNSAMAEIKDLGVLDEAADIAEHYAAQAEESLNRAISLNSSASDHEGGRLLLSLIRFVVSRLH